MSDHIGVGADRVVAEARKLAVDALYCEKGHFAAASRWKYWQFWMGVIATILSGLAGASILTTIFPPAVQEWLPGVLALMASLTTALTVILKPDQVWEKHHKAGVGYGNARRRIRHFVHINCQLPDASTNDLSDRLDALTKEIGVLQKDAPPIPGYGHQSAKKQIAAGHVDYEQSELDAATGPLS